MITSGMSLIAHFQQSAVYFKHCQHWSSSLSQDRNITVFRAFDWVELTTGDNAQP